MTPKKLVQRLETVDKGLQQIRQQLICCEPLDAQVIPLLHQIAETLKPVGSEQELISSSERAHTELRSSDE